MLEDQNDWQKIYSFDELQEGDIVIMEDHVYIRMDGGKCLDQNYCILKSNGSDRLIGKLYSDADYRDRFRCAFRYNG